MSVGTIELLWKSELRIKLILHKFAYCILAFSLIILAFFHHFQNRFSNNSKLDQKTPKRFNYQGQNAGQNVLVNFTPITDLWLKGCLEGRKWKSTLSGRNTDVRTS